MEKCGMHAQHIRINVFSFYLFDFQCYIFEFIFLLYIHIVHANEFAKRNGEAQQRCVMKKDAINFWFIFIFVIQNELRRFNSLSHTSFRAILWKVEWKQWIWFDLCGWREHNLYANAFTINERVDEHQEQQQSSDVACQFSVLSFKWICCVQNVTNTINDSKKSFHSIQHQN